ncbi:MAG: ABC transporter substrate-binding protein [Syntrophobacteraceae bacterium]
MRRPLRIISLSPGQTEILAALGLTLETEGITENCDYPPEALGKRTFGTWFAPDLNGVMAARPDLVCTFGKHQEEAREVLQDAGLRLFHGNPDSVEASLTEMFRLGCETGREEAGRTLMTRLQERLTDVRRRIDSGRDPEPPSVFRIMNWDPLITVGPGAFQHDVIRCAGGRNAHGEAEAPYVVCPGDLLGELDPDAVFFCEPFIRSILLGDPAWSTLKAVKTGRIFVFDCGLTCRSGPRILDMVESLAAALHPDLFPS